jgi:MFS family permease
VKANRQLWIISSTLFLSMLGFGLTLPALPYFVERLALGSSAAPAKIALHVGLLTSAYALSQVMLGPVLGSWSDRWGRKPFLLIGLVGFALSQMLFGLGTSLGVLYLARLAGGGAAAALLTASSAAVSDLFDGPRRREGMAWKGTAASLGVVVGPAMSGLLIRDDMHGHRMMGRLMLDGFSVPFFVAAALAIAAVIPVAFLLDETARVRPPSEVTKSRPPLTDLLVMSAAAQLSLAAFEAIFALYGRDVMALSVARIGWAFVVCGAVMAVFQGLFARWVGSKMTLRAQLALGFFALGLGMAALGVAESFSAALASISVLSLGIAIITPNLTAAVADRRPGEAGSALGLQNTAGGLGQVVGPAAGSLLFAANARAPFVLASALALGVAVWLLISGRPDEQRPD